MKSARIVCAALHLSLIFGLACWFRLSSIEAMPEHIGDEADYGIQGSRFLAGMPYSFRTATRNVMDPFFVAMQLPGLALAKPSLWVLRLPAALSGVLTVLAVYLLGVRPLGRPTALLAAAVVATMPAAIVSSRIGCEFSQTPLVGAIALMLAFRGNGPGLLLTCIASLMVHPTNVLIVPIVLSVYLAKRVPAVAEDRASQLRIVLPALLASTILVAYIALSTLGSVTAQAYRAGHPVRGDWPAYLAGIARYLSGTTFYQFKPILYPHRPISITCVRLHDVVFWVVAIVALVTGIPQLVRTRRWDAAILPLGIAASLVGLHVVSSSDVLWSDSYRYGTFLIVPCAVALASLMGSLPAAPRVLNASRIGPAPIRQALVFTLCWAMLWSVKKNYFDFFTSRGTESLWTFQTDAKDAQKQALSLIVRDAARTGGPAPITIVGGNFWNTKPLEFFTVRRNDIAIEQYDQLDPDFARCEVLLRRKLEAGAYGVGFAGGWFEKVVRFYYPVDRLVRWDVPNCRGDRYLSIYRLKRSADDRTPRTAQGPLSATSR
jgi:hypothetical protein